MVCMRSQLAGRRLAPLLALVVLFASGCASYRLLKDAELAEAREEWDDAVAHYVDLAGRNPREARWRSALLRARLQASRAHFAAGQRFLEAGVPERALVELERAVALDSTNQYAESELAKVREKLARESAAEAEPTVDELKKKQRDAPAQPPLLNPRSRSPISLTFPEPASLFKIYEALGKAFGINVLRDPQLRDQELAIELRDVTAQIALETLMRTVGHFYKVIDEQTILIAQDTQQNRKTYEDLVIQTFYLSNAEVKDAMQLVRSVIGARSVNQNAALNAFTIKDTADRVRVAQRLVEMIDKAHSEVVIDIELIQLNTTKLRELGISLSENRLGQRIDLGKDVPIRFPDLRSLNQQSFVLTVPSLLYDFMKTSSDAQLLARPQIRVTEGQKAKVRIGDQVPIPVTTFNTGQTVGGNIVPITSFQYKDVGINIDLKPRVHHNREVTLELQIEVSQITGFQEAGGGQRQPIIGTRTIESTIRLKDGETNFLAGLIRTDETHGETGLPGLSDIPILGRIFGKTTSDLRRTDVMLTLTPHIVRTANITESDLAPIWVGTESNLTFRGGSPRVESDAEGPFDEGEQSEEELEQLRQEIEQQEEEEEVPEEVPGVELAPSGLPSSPFSPPQEEPSEEEPPQRDFGLRDLVRRDDARQSAVQRDEASDSSAAAASSSQLELMATRSASTAGTVGEAVVRLTLDPAVVNVAVGDRFSIAIAVEARAAVSHLPSTLLFDAALLALESVEAGDFLGGAGAAQVLADSSSPGTIVLGASRLGREPGVAGRGTLAHLHFRALAAGKCELRFSARRVLDPSLVELAGVETEIATIEVRAREPRLRPDGEVRTPVEP